MWTSTKSILLSISLLLAVGSAAASSREVFFPDDEGERREYAVALGFGEARLSGICVVKCMEGEVVGSLLNEFGIRAFDFRYDPKRGRVRLSNLTAFLDRWYIRRTLRRDLALLLQCGAVSGERVVRGRSIRLCEDGSLELNHMRRALSYRFTPLDPNRDER